MLLENTMMAAKSFASANDQKYANKAKSWVNSVLSTESGDVSRKISSFSVFGLRTFYLSSSIDIPEQVNISFKRDMCVNRC